MSDPDFTVGQPIWFLRDGDQKRESGRFVGRGAKPGRSVVSVGGPDQLVEVQRSNVKPKWPL